MLRFRQVFHEADLLQPTQTHRDFGRDSQCSCCWWERNTQLPSVLDFQQSALQWGLNEHKPVLAEQLIGTDGHGLLVLLSPVHVSSDAGKFRLPSGLSSSFMICWSISLLTLLF
jgi:hypothetical protein